MTSDVAVVMDVAGTMLRMYRVAKDMFKQRLLERVNTIGLIMENQGRALVVPQKDPAILSSCPSEYPISAFIGDRADSVEISCFSTPVSRDEALDIIKKSTAKISDLLETHEAVRSKCPNSYLTTGLIVDCAAGEVAYLVSTGGVPFPGLVSVLDELKDMNVDLYAASGDSMRSLTHLQNLGIPLNHIVPVATPRVKESTVKSLKKRYRKVVMIGDGLNDLFAIEAADLGVLTVQQPSMPPLKLKQAADVIIDDIGRLPSLVRDHFFC